MGIIYQQYQSFVPSHFTLLQAAGPKENDFLQNGSLHADTGSSIFVALFRVHREFEFKKKCK